MKTFEMKTVIHFGDNALDRLQNCHTKKLWGSQIHSSQKGN